MILILILLILIGLSIYCMFKAYYIEDSNSVVLFIIGTLFFFVLLLRCIAIELNLITIT